MILNNFNLNQLKVFEAVFSSKSMTIAARNLNLTQSGVSQHIAALEQELGVVLFERISQKLIANENARLLHKVCEESFKNIEDALIKITGDQKILRGRVRIGLPVEFGNNMILPILGEFSKLYPKVDFKLDLGFGYEMIDLLIQGEMDFAFFDDVITDKRLKYKRVYDEKLNLCVTKKSNLSDFKFNKFNIKDFPCVCYQSEAPMIKKWLKFHYGLTKPELNIRAVVMDVMGVAKLITKGVGAGILPLHFMETHPAISKKLEIIRPGSAVLHNTINLATLQGRENSELVSLLTEFIFKALKA